MKALAQWWQGPHPLPLPGPRSEGTASLYAYLTDHAPPVGLAHQRTPDPSLPWLEQIITATSAPQLYADTPTIQGVQSQTRHLRFAKGEHVVIDTPHLEDCWFFRLNHITVEQDTQLTWIVLPNSQGQTHFLQSTHFHLGQNAHLKVIHLHSQHMVSHQHQRVHLKGVGATVEEYGLFVPTTTSLLSYDSSIIAAHPQATVHQTLRSAALEGKVHIVGNIHILQTAPQAEAHFNHQGIVLSDKAAIQAYPQLMIETDAVSCSHSNGIGPIDGQVLRYLQTRGWSALEAQRLYLSGFFGPVTEALSHHPLAQAALDTLLAQLKRMPA